ncbi:MAG: CvpA family protein [Campylobacterales bacterium]|nr:CvpA family protein [Campylobacterales bacterium]
MENLNLFDIIVLSLVTILGLKGLLKGFTKEFFALVGIVGGVFIASRVAKDVGAVVNSIIPMQNENTILLAGFIAALSIFWIIAYFLGSLLEKVFTISGLGIFDKILGFVFASGKIFLLFSIISYAASQVKVVNDNLEKKLQDSVMFPILKQTGGYIIKLDAGEFQQQVSKGIDKVVETTKETIQDISKEELEKRAMELQKQLKETTLDK